MALGGLKGTLSLTGPSVGSSNALAGSVSVAVGDLVFVAFAQQTALTASSVSDNLGNSYSAINVGTDAGVVTGRAFYSRVTVGGTLTSVSVAATSSTNDFAGLAAVIEGPVQASPLNANPANGSNDTASPFTCPATGSLSMSHQVVLCACMHDNNVSLSATSPNLLAGEANRANAAVAIGYQLVSSTSTISPEFTGTNPAANVLITASFRADLLPSLYSDSDTFFTPTVTPGAVDLAPALYADSDSFNTQTVSATYGLTAPLFDDVESFFSPTVEQSGAGSQDLQPSLYSDAETFFSPTVAPGVVDLAPSLFSDADSFFTQTVAATYDLGAALYSDADQFFAPTAAATYGLLPSLFADAETFFSPSVTATYDLAPSLYADTDSFFSATVSGGEANLQPALYQDGDAFFSPTVGAGPVDLQPSLFTDAETFFTTTVATSYGLLPALLDDGDTFFGATVGGGAGFSLSPALFVDEDAFFGAAIAMVTDLGIPRRSWFGPATGRSGGHPADPRPPSTPADPRP